MLWMSLAAQAEPQRLELAVVAPSAMRELRVWAHASWLGEERTIELLDDGSTPGDRANDGVRVAEWRGEPVQALTLQLTAQERPDSPVVEIYAATEVLFSPDDALSWDLHLGPPLRAERTARPLSSDAPQRDERVQVAAAIGWAIFVLNLVGWLAYLARRKP